ncbi:MAG TPA: DUF5666 domain-containing protein [Terriglobales bacterium]|nr:DUF5666 domain-containing protein [Terriglobales bacterium]
MHSKPGFLNRKYFLAVFLTATLICAYISVVTAQDAPPQGGRGRFGDAGFIRISGTIESIDASSMIVKGDDGKTVTVQLNSETRYRKDRQPAKPSDFAKGDHVFVGAQPGSDESNVTARFVATGMGPGGMGQGGPPSPEQMRQMGLGTKFIAGQVKAIDDTKLTILRPDGETQIIQADETTSFQNQTRESITLADIKVGDHVMGRGEMKGGIFVPSTLRVGMPRFMSNPPEPPTK